MKKWFQKTLYCLSAVLFAFSPLMFAGCDLGGLDDSGSDGSGSGGSGGNSGSNYKVSDYLSAVKVSYATQNNSSSTNDDVQQFATDTLNISQMMAEDTLVALLQQYAMDDTNGRDIEYGSMSKHYDTSQIPFGEDIEKFQLTDSAEKSSSKETSSESPSVTYYYDSSAGNNYYDSVKSWKMFNGSGTNNFSKYLQAFSLDKITYAILLISKDFGGVSEQSFDSAYDSFKTNYESATNGKSNLQLQALNQTIAYNVKHTALSGESEIKAFKQYIEDYVIGSDLIEKDQKEFGVVKFDSGGSAYYVNDPTATFEGEAWHFVETKSDDASTSETKTKDISEYYFNELFRDSFASESINKFAEKIQEVYTFTNVKMWQDLDNDGEIDMELVKTTNQDYNAYFPKYKSSEKFRNYKYTVSYIVDKVTSEENKISYLGDSEPFNSEKDENGKTYLNGYPIVSNAYMVDYAYSELEVSSDMSATYSTKIAMRAYKGFVLCLADRSLQDVKNSLGVIYLLMESMTGDEIGIDLYARYYRSGSGYATWGENSYYKLTNTTQTINGPYELKHVNGTFEEGCLLELDFTELLKNAQFNGKTNTNSFDYSYQDVNGNTKNVEIYELKKFPDNFYDTTTDISKRVKHATVFDTLFSGNQLYDVLSINGQELYSYSPKNLSTQSDFEYIEILFATTNNKVFSFGFTGYVPATENHM